MIPRPQSRIVDARILVASGAILHRLGVPIEEPEIAAFGVASQRPGISGWEVSIARHPEIAHSAAKDRHRSGVIRQIRQPAIRVKVGGGLNRDRAPVRVDDRVAGFLNLALLDQVRVSVADNDRPAILGMAHANAQSVIRADRAAD